MVVSSIKFISDIVLFIRNLLREQITDPLPRDSTDFILTAYPKKSVKYPIITIKQTNVEVNKLGIASEVCRANVYLEIRIWGRNSKESDGLLSEVIDALRSNVYGTDGTNSEQIFDFNISSVNSVDEDAGENSIRSRIINLNYFAILGQ